MDFVESFGSFFAAQFFPTTFAKYLTRVSFINTLTETGLKVNGVRTYLGNCHNNTHIGSYVCLCCLVWLVCFLYLKQLLVA